MLNKNNGTIIVVEDQEIVRDNLVEKLMSDGYRVLSASNGKEALTAIIANYDKYLVLITDFDMPEKNGVELINEIEKNNSIEFSAYILTTGHAETHPPIMTLMTSQLKAPFYFLSKPYRDVDLFKILKNLEITINLD